MKTRIEISCTEDELLPVLFEVKNLIASTDMTSIELKVFHDKNRHIDLGHSWITVTDSSNPTELNQIYELKKKIAILSDQLGHE